jgi:hypothetical protein
MRLAGGDSQWLQLSDRNAKKNLEPVDGEQVLGAVRRMPLWTWSYKSQADHIRHMGPMAQDFRTAFGLGEDETTIGTLDADGVNMAAIQALEKRTAKLMDENAALKSEVSELKAAQQQILQRLEELLRQR